MQKAAKTQDKGAAGLAQVPRGATRFQRREWWFQRAGWVFLVLVIIGALSGLFGDGPLSNRALENDAARFEYQRFIRSNAETRWKLLLKGARETGRAEIAVNAAFASKFKTLAIQPEPTSTALRDGWWVYEFEIRGAGVTPVEFIVEAKEMGRHRGTIEVDGAAAFAVSQFAYP